MSKAIAILASDIHLSHKAPVARSVEDNWYEVMERTLSEVLSLTNEYDVPLIIAGDIFDRWNSSPELINFAITMFRQFERGVYAIPGQHDLPNHNYQEIVRSAYFTLIESEVIEMIRPNNPTILDKIALYGFPWGYPLKKPEEQHPLEPFSLAVVHSYVWKKGFSYVGAPEDSRVGRFNDILTTYDAGVFGDNHQGFLWTATGSESETVAMNCGTLIRRKIDEVDYKPMVGLLYGDGMIKPHYLDTSKDKFLNRTEARVKEDLESDMTAFLTELKTLGSDSLNFTTAVNHYMNDRGIDKDVRKLILECLE